jgi:hypothetical protein
MPQLALQHTWPGGHVVRPHGAAASAASGGDPVDWSLPSQPQPQPSKNGVVPSAHTKRIRAHSAGDSAT